MTLPVISRAMAFVAVLGVTSAFAQQPAAPASSVPPEPKQAGIPGAPIPPSQFAAARELVISSGLSRSFSGAVTEMSQQLFSTVTTTRPELATPLKAVMQQLQPEFARQANTMIDNAARIYASAMSEKDLKALVNFFNSPVGKRYVNFEPLITTNIEQVMSAWRQGVSVGMMERVRQEMKKKGYDF